MRIGLGIDTGGTFTDAVLMDMEACAVLYAAKSPTTREDLAVGITNALDALPRETLREVATVSLSTTLATNACVEGKGGRARLILIGGYPKVVAEHGGDYGLPSAGEITFVEGGCDRFGQVEAEPDFATLLAEVAGWIGRVDAVAVVEHNGVANQMFERRVKREIESRWDVPVVCGHELFNEYNVLGRAASALLNARLIVVIRDFLAAIGRSLSARDIGADTVIVRSDGTLMASAFARLRPVETILCGPAASVIGGLRLAKEPDALLVDMGGTTTDIAVVRGGMPVPTTGGVRIGAWRTFVQSVQIDTVGLGGDSIVTRDRNGALTIGPRRAMPLCAAAERWPHILAELALLRDTETVSTHPLNEYLRLLRDVSDDPNYSEAERDACRALRAGPMQLDRLAAALGRDYYRLRYDRLEESGVVQRIALTVTDVMHLAGDFVAYDAEAARLGAEFLARCLHLEPERLCETVYERVKRALYTQCVRLLMRIELPEVYGDGSSVGIARLIDESWRQARSGGGMLQFGFKTPAACVGLGAPTHIFLPDVAAALGTRCVVPEYAPVANAVGAISGSVAARCTVEIKPVYGPSGVDGYNVLGTEAIFREKLEDARDAALGMAREGALLEARRRGVTGALDIVCADETNSARLGRGEAEDQELFLGMKVTATAEGSL